MKSIEVGPFYSVEIIDAVKEWQQPWPRRGYRFICIHGFLSVDENVSRPFLIMPTSPCVSCKTRAALALTLDEMRYLSADLSRSYRGLKEKMQNSFGCTPAHREGKALPVQPFTIP